MGFAMLLCAMPCVAGVGRTTPRARQHSGTTGCRDRLPERVRLLAREVLSVCERANARVTSARMSSSDCSQ